MDTLASGETRQRVITYVGPMQFLNDTLERITHSDGRILIDQDDGDKHLQYRIGDHLDNTVASFEDKNGDGILQDPEEILIKQLYYPFGMALEGMIPDSTIPPARFLYGNKAFEAAGGVYFYCARLSVPMIGRFAGVDPIAEQFPHLSVYNYASNDPIKNIDLWGLQGVSSNPPYIYKKMGEGAKALKDAVYDAYQNAKSFFSSSEQPHDVDGGIGLTSSGVAKGKETKINPSAETVDITNLVLPAGGGGGVGKNLAPALKEFNHFLDMASDAITLLPQGGSGSIDPPPFIIDDSQEQVKVCTICSDTLDLDAPQSYHTDFDTIEVKKD